MSIEPPFLRGSLKKDPVDARDYKFTAIPEESKMFKTAEALPVKWDWISEMSPVKYQGMLGSCVGFAVCALKEWQEKKEHEEEVAAGKKYLRGEKDWNLSEQWVYWNAKKIDPWPGKEGTNFRSALKVVQKIGVPTEKGWPYRDDPINIGKPKSWAHMVARWATIESYWRVDSSVEGLKRALMESPVLIGIPCFEEIYGPIVDGLVPYPAKPGTIYGYHAVMAIGFDDDQEIIYIKNSWSKFWGAGGYGKLPYKYIDDFVGDAWVAKDISVTRDMLKGTVTLIE